MIFGGSFEPPHYGHIHALKSVLNGRSFQRVLIIPNRQSPLKSKAHVSPSKKKELLNVFLSDLYDLFPNHRTAISGSSVELDRKAASFMLDTVHHIQHTYPDIEEWWLLIGSDQLFQLQNWHKIDQLLTHMRLCIVPRHSFSKDRANAYLQTCCPHYLAPIWIDAALHPGSATVIRKDPLGQNISNQVPPKVLAYLKRERLFLS